MCSDLGESIAAAIDNSDYLILICSPRTMESEWVKAELHLFLQNHSIDRVLPVLVEGEPKDVIPAVLLEGREPLCCNYRLSPRRAKREELPRLAACILGCRYDDLIRRQKQRKRRKLIIAFTFLLVAIAALAAYFYQSARTIEGYYKDQLRSQSRYLSNESLLLLDAGDRLSAIELALHAMPKGEDDPRPWIPEAEFALGSAIGIYNGAEALRAVNAFSHSSRVMGFLCDENRSRMISWDNSPAIYIWDTENFELLHKLSLDKEVDRLKLNGNQMIFTSASTLYCYDFLTGEFVWIIEEVHDKDFFISTEKDMIIFADSETLYRADSKEGKILDTVPLPEGELLSLLSISPDGGQIAFTTYTDQSKRGILIYDFAKNCFQTSNRTLKAIYHGIFIEDRLVILGCDDILSTSGWISGLTHLLKGTMELSCLDVATGLELWTNHLPYFQVSYEEALHSVEFPVAENTFINAIAASFSNVCYYVNPVSGEVVDEVQMPASAVSVDKSDGKLFWFLRDGNYCYNDIGSGETASIQYFPSNVTRGITGGGGYVQFDSSNQIVLYRFIYDDSLEYVDGTETKDYLEALAVSDRYILLQKGYDSDDMKNLFCYRIGSERTLIWEETVEDANVFHINGDRLYITSGNSEKLRIYDLTDGSVDTRDVLSAVGDGFCFVTASVFLNTYLYCLIESREFIDGEYQSSFAVEIKDLEHDTIRRIKLEGDWPNLYEATLAPSADGSKLWISMSTGMDNHIRVVDLQTEEIYNYDTPLNQLNEKKLSIFVSSQGDRAICLGNHGFCILRAFASEQTEILTSNTPVSACWSEEREEFYILESSGELSRYSPTGALLQQTEIHSKVGSFDTIQWNTDKFMVNVDGYCNLLDPETFLVYAYVPKTIFYSDAEDVFYIINHDSDYNYFLGFYSRYTTQELLDKAKAIKGDFSLTEKQKRAYGLE